MAGEQPIKDNPERERKRFTPTLKPRRGCPAGQTVYAGVAFRNARVQNP